MSNSLIRVKLTSKFVNILDLIPDYNADNTYCFQIQEKGTVDIIESDTMHSLNLDKGDCRVIAKPGDIFEFKETDGVLWLRTNSRLESYISIWRVA